MSDLSALSPGFRLPSIGLPSLGLRDVVQGTLVLALPQAALTLGNAIIATKEENNALFPDRPVSVRLLAADHGVMNLLGAALGGVPMCRGAGGMAGHIRFGARTGGALVILGALLLVVALFLSDSVDTLFRLFPLPVLGVILFFGGMELAASANGDGASRAGPHRYGRDGRDRALEYGSGLWCGPPPVSRGQERTRSALIVKLLSPEADCPV